MSTLNIVYSPSPWEGPIDCPLCFFIEVAPLHMQDAATPLREFLNAASRVASKAKVDGTASQQALHVQLFGVYKDHLRGQTHRMARRQKHFHHGASWTDDPEREMQAVVDHFHCHASRISQQQTSPASTPRPRMRSCESPDTCTVQ